MRYLILSIICVSINMRFCCSQIPECPNYDNGVLIGEKVHIDFVPTDFTPDDFSLPDPEGENTDRLIIWVHGLSGHGDLADGSENSWIGASTQTELDYHSVSQRPDYSDVGIDEASVVLKDQIHGPYAPLVDDKTFIIAHSQGSIVSRWLDHYYYDGTFTDGEGFHGLVTFGGPHQGAVIINNRDDLEAWGGTVPSILSAGPIAEGIEDNFWLNMLFDVTETVPAVENYMSDFFSTFVEPFLFGGLEAEVGESYAVGAPEITELNSYTPDIPIVCFYGLEDEPLIWNTLVYSVPGHLPNDHPPFEAGNDDMLVNLANNGYMKYQIAGIQWDIIADHYEAVRSPFAGYIFIGGDPLDEAKYISEAFLAGAYWWLTANSVWKEMIGALSTESDGYYCSCINENMDDITMDEYPVGPGESCDPEWGDCSVYESYHFVEKQSDGVVLTESAGNCPGMTFSKKMDGSNHFSMRNDWNTGNRLNELFNGNYGSFFMTLER